MKRLYFKYAKLSLYILTILVFVFFGLNRAESQAAVPEAATLVSPSGMITDITPAYTWNAESNSTWYYLWVDDGTGNRITQWYTAEEVAFDVWNGSYWVRLEKFSKNNDTGNHCSHYYNLTPYRNAVPLKILFHTNNSDDMKNGDKLMIDDITIFAW